MRPRHQAGHPTLGLAGRAAWVCPACCLRALREVGADRVLPEQRSWRSQEVTWPVPGCQPFAELRCWLGASFGTAGPGGWAGGSKGAGAACATPWRVARSLRSWLPHFPEWSCPVTRSRWQGRPRWAARGAAEELRGSVVAWASVSRLGVLAPLLATLLLHPARQQSWALRPHGDPDGAPVPGFGPALVAVG